MSDSNDLYTGRGFSKKISEYGTCETGAGPTLREGGLRGLLLSRDAGICDLGLS